MVNAPDLIPAAGPVADKLFVPLERLGWEYVAVEPARPAPQLANEPQWREPAPPYMLELAEKSRQAATRAPIGVLLLIAGFFLLVTTFTSGLRDAGPLALLALVGCLLGGFAMVAPAVAARSERERVAAAAGRERELQRQSFQVAHDEWLHQVAAHDRAEQERLASSACWFPLAVSKGAARIDVVGGTPEGTEVLLAVLGTSLLASGEKITLLDLTGRAPESTLAALLRQCDGTVEVLRLPDGLAAVDLLADVASSEVADLLSSAVHPQEHSADQARRDLAAELLSVVTSVLADPLTVIRVVDGLRVLNRTYTSGSLAAAEVGHLTDAAHDVVVGEQRTEELRSLIAHLRLLVPNETDNAGRQLFGPPIGQLSVVSSPRSRGRQKHMIDHMLAGLLAHSMRGGHGWVGTVIVAGADNIGLHVIDELTRLSRKAGLRIVLVFDALRDGVVRAFGGHNASCVVMQLSTSDEAEAAAKFIGRDHRFVLSQLSVQRGTTKTVGVGESTAVGSTKGATQGSSQGGSRQGIHGGTNWSEQQSTTVSHSVTRTSNSSWSLSESHTDGEVIARSYDFTVEPTQIMSLDTFAFMLVDQMEGTRRIAAGNCDPRITELPRVSDLPR